MFAWSSGRHWRDRPWTVIHELVSRSTGSLRLRVNVHPRAGWRTRRRSRPPACSAAPEASPWRSTRAAEYQPLTVVASKSVWQRGPFGRQRSHDGCACQQNLFARHRAPRRRQLAREIEHVGEIQLSHVLQVERHKPTRQLEFGDGDGGDSPVDVTQAMPVHVQQLALSNSSGLPMRDSKRGT
jgi:hypothetical protein